MDLVDASGNTNLGNDNVVMEIGTNNRQGWYVLMEGGTECVEEAHGNCNPSRSSLWGEEADYYIGSVTERATITAGDDAYGALVRMLKTEESDWEGVDIPRGAPTLAEGSHYEWEDIDTEGGNDSGGAGRIGYG